MGILCIAVSVLFGIVGFMEMIATRVVTAQIFGAELMICACVLFGTGSICMAVSKVREALDAAKPKSTEPTT